MRKTRKRKRRSGLGWLLLFAAVLLSGTGALVVKAVWAVPAAGEMSAAEEGMRLPTVSEELGEGVLKEGAGHDAALEETAEEEAPQDSGLPSAQADAGAAAVSQNSFSGKYASLLADPERMRAENAYPLVTASEDEITLTFAGDILFDGSYAIMAKMKSRAGQDAQNYVESAFDEALLGQMRGADVFMVNNEFTYTDRGTPVAGKAFTFRAKPEHAQLLFDMGADIVSLANNHAYDYGEISLLDTLDTLEGIGMPYVGAGRNLAEAVKPVYFVTPHVKIAFLSATQIERMDHPDTKGAEENSAGVFRCRNVDRLLEEVAKAKAVSDFVVVYIHWGTESTAELDWAQKEQAPLIAEAGADLIIGDHPHVLQGIEWYGDTPVIYSLGNFLFNSKTQDTCLVTVTLDAESGMLESFRFIPALQKDCRTTMLEGTEKQRVISYMQSLSPGAMIDAEGYVTRNPQ